MNFLDKFRLSDSKGQRSWTNTLSVWGFLIGALYVITCTVAGLTMVLPEWMVGAYTGVLLVLVGAVTANMAVRNVAVHWGTKPQSFDEPESTNEPEDADEPEDEEEDEA